MNWHNLKSGPENREPETCDPDSWDPGTWDPDTQDPGNGTLGPCDYQLNPPQIVLTLFVK